MKTTTVLPMLLSVLPVSLKRAGLLVLTVAIAVTMIAPPVRTVDAQGGSATLVFEGNLLQTGASFWIVDSVAFEVNAATIITGNPVIGSRVRVEASQVDKRLIALRITVLPSATLTVTPTLAATPALSGTPTPLGTLTPTKTPGGVVYVLIVIEGPIIKIETDESQHVVVVVHDYRIQLKDDDPLKLKVKVGEWIKVKGKFDFKGGRRFVIAVVIIIIIDSPTVIIVSAGGDDDRHKKNHKNKIGKGHDEDDDD